MSKSGLTQNLKSCKHAVNNVLACITKDTEVMLPGCKRKTLRVHGKLSGNCRIPGPHLHSRHARFAPQDFIQTPALLQNALATSVQRNSMFTEKESVSQNRPPLHIRNLVRRTPRKALSQKSAAGLILNRHLIVHERYLE